MTGQKGGVSGSARDGGFRGERRSGADGETLKSQQRPTRQYGFTNIGFGKGSVEKLTESAIVKISRRKPGEGNVGTFIKLQTGPVTGSTIRSADVSGAARKDLFHKSCIYQTPSFSITKAVGRKVLFLRLGKLLTRPFVIFLR